MTCVRIPTEPTSMRNCCQAHSLLCEDQQAVDITTMGTHRPVHMMFHFRITQIDAVRLRCQAGLAGSAQGYTNGFCSCPACRKPCSECGRRHLVRVLCVHGTDLRCWQGQSGTVCAASLQKHMLPCKVNQTNTKADRAQSERRCSVQEGRWKSCTTAFNCYWPEVATSHTFRSI